MKNVHMVAYILVIVGALNWGLVGLFGMNLVTAILGEGTMFTSLVYILIGAAAVYEVATHKNKHK